METEKIQCAMKENDMDNLLESYNKLSEEIRREIRSSSVLTYNNVVDSINNNNRFYLSPCTKLHGKLFQKLLFRNHIETYFKSFQIFKLVSI